MLSLFRRQRPLYYNDEIELRLSEAGESSLNGVRDSFVFDIHLRGKRDAIGYISLRLGESPELYYLGHIGYRIEARYRGHGYAGKALKLLMPLMQREGLCHAVITTDVDNLPSRQTCVKLGCVLERIAPVPLEHRALCMGSEHKCRYLLLLEPLREALKW